MRKYVIKRSGLFMTGDCEVCYHSIVYHLPFIGCTKCSCDEYH